VRAISAFTRVFDALWRASKGDGRTSVVMPGLVPGIHAFGHMRQGVDGRDKPGHDNK
jgi:hypothetical protein